MLGSQRVQSENFVYFNGTTGIILDAKLQNLSYSWMKQFSYAFLGRAKSTERFGSKKVCLHLGLS